MTSCDQADLRESRPELSGFERALDDWFEANVGRLHLRGDERYDALMEAYLILKKRLGRDPECLVLSEQGPGGLIWKVAEDCRKGAARRGRREIGLERWDDGALERQLGPGFAAGDPVLERLLDREDLRELRIEILEVETRAKAAPRRLAAVAGRRLQGRSHTSIASELDVVEATARKRWSRFIASLPTGLRSVATAVSAARSSGRIGSECHNLMPVGGTKT